MGRHNHRPDARPVPRLEDFKTPRRTDRLLFIVAILAGAAVVVSIFAAGFAAGVAYRG